MTVTLLSEEFGRSLRALREDLGLTQQALAARAGVARYTVLRLEQGENVGINQTHRLAWALGARVVLQQSIRPTWENAREIFLGDQDE